MEGVKKAGLPLAREIDGAIKKLAVGSALLLSTFSLVPPDMVKAATPAAPPPAAADSAGKEEATKKIEEKAALFGEILKDLQDAYVEPVDIDKLAETGYNAMLSSLDPFTEFENPQAAQQMKVQTYGNYGGVGLIIAKPVTEKGVEGEYINVMGAMEGFAFQDGVRVGDKVLSIDGKDCKDMSVTAASDLLKGPPGTKVLLSIERPGAKDLISMELQRRVVLLRDVPLATTLGGEEDGVGYIKLQGFSASATQELAYVITRLQQKQPLSALILDLRGNPGGLLQQAIKVADLFLKEGDEIVTTRGRTLQPQEEGKAPSSSTFETKYTAQSITASTSSGTFVFHPPLLNAQTKLVVLVNRQTASAAEIVAGSIQDHDRGVIVGEQTFGKGLVQQLQQLGTGGTKIKYTIGKYYTPSGRCIQSKTYADAGPGNVGTKASQVSEDKRKVFYTDAGRAVKDAGGIEPDVAVAAAPAGQLERELERREAFFKFATQWQQDHAADGETLAQGSEPVVTDDVYKEFQRFVKGGSSFESPFDKSLGLMQDALKESGYEEALGDVQSLKKHLSDLLLDEFNKDQKAIKKRVEMAIRSRYAPESTLLAMGLDGDLQVERALELAKDSDKYLSLVSPGPGPKSADAKAAADQLTLAQPASDSPAPQ